MSHAPQYPGDPGKQYGHTFPDIGPDPHKEFYSSKPIEEWTADAIKRFRQALAVQQKGVPDQTALVWRVDIDRVLTSLIVASMQRDELRKEVEKLKEPLVCAITVARDMEQQQK